MIIDVVFAFVLVLAGFKGLRKGLVLGIFSFFAFIIGLAAALKLSVVVADHLKSSGGTSKFLPLLSFMVVFTAVVLLVNLGARLIQKVMRFAMLGWVDRLGGMILFICIYTIIFSVFLFFAEKLHFVGYKGIQNSVVYPIVSPWGPRVIENIGKIFPLFQDMFEQLQIFFGGLAKKPPP